MYNIMQSYIIVTFPFLHCLQIVEQNYCWVVVVELTLSHNIFLENLKPCRINFEIVVTAATAAYPSTQPCVQNTKGDNLSYPSILNKTQSAKASTVSGSI